MAPRRGPQRHDQATHAYLQISNPGDPAPTYGFIFGNASACSFTFSVSHVKLYSEMFGFRFLDLPPELRNKVYGLTFSDKYGLRPHGLTQTNKQIRQESLKMFYADAEVFDIPLRTASQVTCFLKWMSDRKHRPNPTATTLDFSYLDLWRGATTIRLERELVWPKAVAEEFGAKEQATGSNLPLTHTLLSGTVVPHPRLVKDAWQVCIGLPDLQRMGFCRSFRNHVRLSSDKFLLATTTGSSWATHRITITAERRADFCYCTSPHRFFMMLVKEMDGGELHVVHLRRIAFYLFRMTLMAEERLRLGLGDTGQW